jgi:hypothetical protein
MNKKSDDQFTDSEARKRFEAALRGGFKTPAKPHSQMKLGKRKSNAKTKVLKKGL